MHDGAGRRCWPEALPAKLQHQPGRDDHGDEEGEDHRRRGVGRDRAHIGAHHARHEEHRQQRGDDGQRCDDRRVADLRHRLDRRRATRDAPVAHPQWRAMFSITTMASSTRMPMEKISAKSVTRFSV